MEESGVPVQDDWSTAPEEDRVRFSLSGVTPHSWRDTEEGGEGQAPGKEWGHREGLGPRHQEAVCRARANRFLFRPHPPALGWKGCLPGEVPASVSMSCRRLSICSGHTKAGAQVTQVTQQL